MRILSQLLGDLQSVSYADRTPLYVFDARESMNRGEGSS